MTDTDTDTDVPVITDTGNFLLDRTTDFEFVDFGDRESSPVHVTRFVRINGERVPLHFHPDEPVEVCTPASMRGSELRVRLVVLPTDATFTEFPARPGVVAIDRLAGIPVLTPPEGWSYVGGQPAVIRSNLTPDYPRARDEEGNPEAASLWIEVWVQARSVAFTYEPKTKPEDTT